MNFWKKLPQDENAQGLLVVQEYPDTQVVAPDLQVKMSLSAEEND
jgi:hypothetical protein